MGRLAYRSFAAWNAPQCGNLFWVDDRWGQRGSLDNFRSFCACLPLALRAVASMDLLSRPSGNKEVVRGADLFDDWSHFGNGKCVLM